jgi:type II secretory pathway pseudopilin PulG
VRRARQRGMTLVDVLVAIILLASSMVILLGLVSRSISAQRQGENLEVAAMILDEQLNMVLALGPDEYAARYGERETPAEAPFESFRYRVSVTPGAAGDAYRIVATVLWMEGGRERVESVETRIAPRLGDDPDPDRRPAQTVDRLAGGVP